jgi:hypothetical protein
MNRPDLELPEGWKEASKEGWDDFCVVEWELKPENEYAFKVGFWHGAIWRQKLNQSRDTSWDMGCRPGGPEPHSIETLDPDGTKS